MNKIHPVLAFGLPKLRDILLIGVLFGLVVMGGPKIINADGDLGRHITIGNHILDSGSIPVKDIFSHTLYGEKLVPHEWLADVAFALAHRVMGLSGDLLLAALVIAMTVLLMYEEMIKRGVMRLNALAVTLWLISISAVHWLVRPHIFTFLFVALWTYRLETIYKGESKNIGWFALVMLMWVNTHGAYIAGFVIWGTYFADWLLEFWQGRGTKEMGWRLGAIGGVSLLVTFINPSGWHIWGTSVGYLGNDFLTQVTVEYMSPNFHDRGMWLFMFMIAFGLFSLVQDRRLQVREGLLFAGWTIMSLYSIRNFPLFAVVNAPIIGGLAQSWLGKVSWLLKRNAGIDAVESKLRGHLWSIFAFVAIGALLWHQVPLDLNRRGNIYLPEKMPVKAVDWLTANPQEGKMFNHFVWGGYLLYRTWPNDLVFIDGQTDFYGESLTREYLTVVSGDDGWQTVLDKYGVEWILLRGDDPLAVKLSAVEDDGWLLIYEDDLAVIFRRD